MAAAPESNASHLALPHRFGSTYVLFDRIGAGGMAEIYLARRATRIGASGLAVVKLVLPALAGDARFATMLTAEAKLAARLSHGNIVQTYDLGREDGRLYIAMEYVEGFDLNELLRRCSRARVPMPIEYALFIVGETLRALDYAHRARDAEGRSLGVVHRDVSPSNVLVSFEGEVKLCDFGIARAADLREDLGADAIEGKASYMSPEHARGEPIDGRADIFAASILLWEMLAGRRMYRTVAGGPDALTLAREAAVPPLPERGLPDEARLAAIVARGLATDRDARYPTALAMARELDAYMMATGLRASPLRLGGFLTDNFGGEIIEARRAHEHAAAALDPAPADDAALDTTAPTLEVPAPNEISAAALPLPPPTPEDEHGATDPALPLEADDEALASRDHSAVRMRVPEPSPSLAPPPEAPPPTAPVAPASAPVVPARRGWLVGAAVLTGLGVVALGTALGYLLGHH